MRPTLQIIVIIGIIVSISIQNYQLLSQTLNEEEQISEYLEDNQQCLDCHGQRCYYYYNDWIEKDVRERMNPFLIIDSARFYNSNHWNFSCTDCHSTDYLTFPHPGELRMEPKFECLDCHEGDEQYAQYNFEKIQDEFLQSVHSSKHSEDFTCCMCHDPHEYKITARNHENIEEFILYDNEICLSCHADISKYQMLTTLDNPNILDKHGWLPNETLHFKHVRCIECHTEISDTLLVAHKILPKEQAVKRCVECHSKNSRLLLSLYKMQFTNQRSITGFSNAEILDEAYIIGANRNYYLNRLSLILFGITIILIAIHAILRLTIKHS